MNIFLITNHSFMLYKFRKELIQQLLVNHHVTLVMPAREYTDAFRQMGCDIMDVDIDRRGINPLTDYRLLRTYRRILKQHHPDMLQWGFRDCGDTVRERHLGDYAVSGEAAVAEKVDIALRSYMFSALWARAYRRSLIEKQQLRFRPELAIGEDQAFIFSYALGVKKLVSASTILYNTVLENRESLSRKRRDYLTAQLLRVNEVMFQELDKAGVSAQTNHVYQAALAWVHYRSAYSCCKELLKYGLSRKERKKKIKEICNLYAEKQVKAQDMKCRIIAFPVNHQISSIMDILICRG